MTQDITDQQIVEVLKRRKDSFVSNSDLQSLDTQDTWIFNHVCTVLDHAIKIMEVPEEQFIKTAANEHNMFMP